MYNGSKEIAGAYLGTKELAGVYLGDKEIWTSSKPWVAIAEDGTLTSPCVKPVAITNNGYVQLLTPGNIYAASGGYGITTKNADGTFFIPTNRCKFMRVRLYNMTGYAWNYIIVGKKKDGSEEVVKSIRQNGGTSGWYGTYKDHTDIDVSGYESIRVYSESATAHYAGLGCLEFYN